MQKYARRSSLTLLDAGLIHETHSQLSNMDVLVQLKYYTYDANEIHVLTTLFLTM